MQVTTERVGAVVLAHVPDCSLLDDGHGRVQGGIGGEVNLEAMPDVSVIVMLFAVVCKEMQQMEHIISERGSVWHYPHVYIS